MKKIFLFIFNFLVIILGIGAVSAKQFDMTCEFNVEKEYREYHIGFSDDKKTITSCSYKNKYTGEWVGCGSGYTVVGTATTGDCPPIKIDITSKTITFVNDSTKEYTGSSYYNSNVSKNICSYTFDAQKGQKYKITFTVSGDYFTGVSKCIGPNGTEFECYLENKTSQAANSNGTPLCPSSFNILEDGKVIKMMTGHTGTYHHFAGQGDKTVEQIGNSVCSDYANKESCKNATDADCIWYGKGVCKTKKLSCGSGTGAVTDIPRKIPDLTSMIFTVIQIAIPIILVLMGSIDLFKGITANKEDEIKKGQQMFIKRLVVAAVIFLVVIIIKFFISIVADANVSNIVDCIDCFVSNDCEGV